MAGLFDDEILSVVLRFSNPNRGEMQDAAKVAAQLSQSLDSVIRKGLGTGRSIQEIGQAISRISPKLRDLEKSSAAIASHVTLANNAERILSRYTPFRLEEISRNQANRSEASGASNKTIGEELKKQTRFLERLAATNEGKYERVSGSNKVGTGVFLDVGKINRQLQEIGATLFSFNKETREILNSSLDTVSVARKLGQEIGALDFEPIQKLIKQADFIVSHNASIAKSAIQGAIPGVQNVPWLDSRRGVPWQLLGNNSRALHDLMRLHGVDNALNRRPGANSEEAVKLLASRSQLGGQNYLSMLLGNQGPLTKQQQMLSVVVDSAKDILRNLKERIGEGNRNDPTSVRYARALTNQSQRSQLGLGLDEKFSRAIITAIESYAPTARGKHPASSTQYGTKYGSGQNALTTPGNVGASSIALDRRIGTITEFIRNAKIASGTSDVGDFLELYARNASYQERIQAARGRSKGLNKDNLRQGDEFALSVMSGVNTRLYNQRNRIIPTQLDATEHSVRRYREHERQRAVREDLMLSQPWAQPKGNYTNKEIDEFVSRRASNRGAYVFDIDKTLLSNSETPKGGLDAFANWARQSSAKMVEAGKALYDEAVANGHEIHLITARGAALREATIKNLRAQGMGNYDSLSMPPFDKGFDTYDQVALHKAGIRRYLTESGITVLKNIGDSDTDFRHGWYREGVKVENESTTKPFEVQQDPIAPVVPTFSHREIIGKAAQMANSVGRLDPRFQDLTDIMFETQARARAEAERSKFEQEEETRKRLFGASSSGGSSGRRSFRQMAQESIDQFLSEETGTDFFTGAFFEKLFNRKRRESQSASESYDQRAEKAIPDPTSLRGSIRRDALEQKLRSLEEAFGKAAEEFNRYRDEIAQSRKAELKFSAASRQQAILSGQATFNSASQYTIDSLGRRRGRNNELFTRRSLANADRQDASLARLSERELRAEGIYSNALRDRDRATAKLLAQRAKEKGKPLTASEKADANREVNAGIASANLNYQKAKFERESATIVDPEDLEKLKRNYAARVTETKFGLSGDVSYLGQLHQGPAADKFRQDYQERVMETLSPTTLAQRSQTRQDELKSDTSFANTEIRGRIDQAKSRRQQNDAKVGQKLSYNYAKYQYQTGKIDAEVEARAERLGKRRMETDRKIHEAKVKFLKQEDAMGGGGSGGGKGSGSGSGSGRGGGLGILEDASRSGWGFGLGLSGVVAFDQGIKELIKDSAIYAAKVETMEFSTDQLAKTSGLNAAQVRQEVQVLKDHNLTTEEANSVVQKLMMSNQDLAKSAKLVEVAQNLAALSGQDAMQTVERLMSGVVTGYTRNLHQLGLQVTSVSALRQLKSDKLAKGDKSAPTETERREAIVDQIIQQGAKLSGTYERSLTTAGGQFAYLRKEALEASNAIGQEFLPAFGRAVSIMTSGLKYVQENAGAFSKLTSVLAGLGVTANALGTVAFLRWAAGAAPLPPWAKAVAVGGSIALGGAVTGFLNQDQENALRVNKDDVVAQLRQKNLGFESDSRRVLGQYSSAKGDYKKDLENELKYEATSIEANNEAIAGIESNFNNRLATIYLQRINERKKFLENFDKAGFFGKYALALQAEFSQGFNVFSYVNPSKPLPVPGKDAAQRSDVENLAKAIAAENARVAGLPPSLRNREAVDDEVMANRLSEAQQKLVNLSDKTFAAGEDAIKRKFERGSQTPRERIAAEEEIALYTVQNVDKFVDHYQQKVKTTSDPEKLKVYQQKLDEAIDLRDNAGEYTRAIKEVSAGAYARINNKTSAELLGIEAQTNIDLLRSGSIKGSYESQYSSIQGQFGIAQGLALDKYDKLHDPDQRDVELAEASGERTRQLAALQASAKEGARGRYEAGLQDTSEQAQEGILSAYGLTSQQAINSALQEEVSTLMKLSDDEQKLKLIQDARVKSRQKLKQLAAEEAESALNRGIELRNQKIDFQTSLSNVLSANTPGTSEYQNRLNEIEENRIAERDKAEGALTRKLQFLDTEAGKTFIAGSRKTRDYFEREYRNEAQASYDSADQTSARSVVDAVGAEVASRRDRLVDAYKEAYEIKSKTISATAGASGADERSTVEQIHRLRLEYIEKEYQARNKTLDAERTKNQQILQLESDKLQQMLDARRKQVDAIKSFSETLFETVTTNHGRGLRDLLLGQVRSQGAKIFGNIMSDLFKNVHVNLPGLTDKNGKQTKLGRIMQGTIPGTVNPSDKALHDQQAKVAKALQDTEDDSNRVLKEILDVLKDLDQHRYSSSSSSSTPIVLPTSSGGGTIIAPIGMPGGGDTLPGFGGTNIYGGDFPFGFPPGPPLSIPTTSNDSRLPGGLINRTGRTIDGVPSLGSYPDFNFGRTGTDLPSIPASGGSIMLIGPATHSVIGNGNLSSTVQQAVQSLSKPLSKGSSPEGVGVLEKAIQDQMGNSGIGALGGIGIPQGSAGFPGFPGFPGGSSSPGTSTSAKGLGNYVAGAAMTGSGLFQALSNFGHGKGARGDAFGVGGVLQAAAGITSMIPGAQIATPFLEGGAMLADLVGSLFGDPRQQRQNQESEYLALNQYLAPPKLSLTSDLQGNLVSEGKGGLAQDTGILTSSVKIQDPYLLQENTNPSISNLFSNPGAYLSDKPNVYQVNPGYFGDSSNLPGNSQLQYTPVPGQILYNDLPANATPVNYNMNMTVQALDSKSILDRSPDIALAVQKELITGNQLSSSLQSAIFGVK